MSFVFLDAETTGLELGFDQIIHFAAIRTDNDLNETGRFQVRSQLLPYVVPHPQAMLTNGLSIAQLTDKALPTHYEMVVAIREKLLAWSPSIFVGFNSIRFDEEMLRHAFFQTLHPPFLTSDPRSSRGDVLSLVMAGASATPPCLSVPRTPEGRPTYRLEALLEANGIPATQSHDALADVLATIALCRLVHTRAPDLWHRFVRFSKKATVADFIDGEDAFVLTEFFNNEANHMPVVCLGPDPGQTNIRLCLRLDIDLEQVQKADDVQLTKILSSVPSPIRRLRTNASPTLTALYDAPADLFNTDTSVFEAHAQHIKNDGALCQRLLTSYLAGRAERPQAVHLEKRIYEGDFPPPADEKRCALFHRTDWHKSLPIIESLEDARLRAFGLRLMYCERRSVLPPDQRQQLERELTDRLITDAGGLTLTRALAETDALIERDGACDILNGYRAYLVGRQERVTAFRARALNL